MRSSAGEHLVHTDEVASTKSAYYSLASGANEPGTRSSAGEHALHTGGVVGSIPTASTIPFQFDMLHQAEGGSLGPGSVVLGTSWGNDSVALVQWCVEQGLTDVTCLYNDTGWSWLAYGNQEGWSERVDRMEAWARSLGYKTARTRSLGMEANRQTGLMPLLAFNHPTAAFRVDGLHFRKRSELFGRRAWTLRICSLIFPPAPEASRRRNASSPRSVRM